ncbi:hypothetical protein BOTCAL_0459g00020 [Botryotinia calthae]|uniref:Uncharacterized protein n=1 Tax=Botryotinia calthae TaxID=38488 RepID=A0A4Y8CQ08_9HELO|nr:hypothetical protein BOTCAL_0459g00020 [Botryotinia calthae]
MPQPPGSAYVSGCLNHNGNNNLRAELVASPRSPTAVHHQAPVFEISSRAFLAPTPLDLPKWPTGPQAVASSSLATIFDSLLDVIFLALSTLFLLFGLRIYHKDQVPIAKFPRETAALLEAAKYGPTVFPILFASVIARATHAILLWRLERGEDIGVLDVLAGSTSLASSVISQLKLRIFSFVGIPLIVIWALSPIGGQASFRQLTISKKILLDSTQSYYMISTGNMPFLQFLPIISWFSIVNAIFMSSVMGPPTTKSSPADIWGNVKIPYIERYENGSTPDSKGWFSVNSTNSIYSSLVGVPISGLDSLLADSTYTMNLESTYLYLECPVLYDSSQRTPDNVARFVNKGPDDNVPYRGLLGPLPNGADPIGATGSGASIWSFDNNTERVNMDPTSLTARTFTYLSWGPTAGSNCTIKSTYVEVAVTCRSSSTCTITKIRRSRLSNPPAAYSLLETKTKPFPNPYGGNNNWWLFSANFVNSINDYGASDTTAVQGYLLNPDDPLSSSMGINGVRNNKLTVTNDVYAERLGQLFNTYWTCMNGLHAISGGMTTTTAVMPGTNLSDENVVRVNSSSTNVVHSRSIEVIQCHIGWVIVLLAASTVLILASLVGPIIRYFLAKGPDIDLNISSLATRNNPYITLPPSGSSLGASERLRLLKDVRVMFGDVNGTREIGKMAIATCGSREVL